MNLWDNVEAFLYFNVILKVPQTLEENGVVAKGRRGKSHRKLLHIKWLPVSPPEGKLARVVVLTNYYILQIR